MRFVLAAALLAGCYKPNVTSCQLTCAADGSCPDGFSCSTANHCVATGETDTCGGVVDGAPLVDVSVGIDGNPCDFTVSNVSGTMCALLGGNPTGELDVTSGTPIITGMVDDPVFPPMGTFGLSLDDMGVQIVVIVVTKLTVAQGVQLAITGDRPLVLVSLGDIDVEGDIDDIATPTGAAECGTIAMPAQGGGGAGGGYGDIGGAGGPVSTGGAGAPGLAENGSMMLVPLRPGCAGGTGGRLSTGGAGGAAGAGLELAAHGQLRVGPTGMVRVNGVGGDGNKGASAGAGGGGSGGALFLEAAHVVLGSGASLCANGGPGGSTNSTNGPVAPSTNCTATPTPATSSGALVLGGAGGAAGGPAGAGGAGSPIMNSSAGGGGGGVGRIRIHGQLTDSGSETTPFPVLD